MPRARFPKPAKTSTDGWIDAKTPAPRLWNAHRRIKTSKTLAGIYAKPEELKQSKAWQEFVTPDVAEYAEKADLTPEARYLLLKDPNRYFSYPANVPTELRKQVYLCVLCTAIHSAIQSILTPPPSPRFTVTLMRTPHLPPKYASFEVPLWFNKLDMKSYLSSAYNVQVIHIRSTVLQSKVENDRDGGRGNTKGMGQGRLRRPMAKKKMTVELVEPFVWPDEIKDFTAWEKESYWETAKENMEAQRKMQADAILKPNEKQRKSIAEQAKEMLQGKRTWKPTWQSLPTDVRVMQGSTRPALPSQQAPS